MKLAQKVFFVKKHTDVVTEALVSYISLMKTNSLKREAAVQTWKLWSGAIMHGARFCVEVEVEEHGDGKLIVKR